MFCVKISSPNFSVGNLWDHGGLIAGEDMPAMSCSFKRPTLTQETHVNHDGARVAARRTAAGIVCKGGGRGQASIMLLIAVMTGTASAFLAPASGLVARLLSGGIGGSTRGSLVGGQSGLMGPARRARRARLGEMIPTSGALGIHLCSTAEGQGEMDEIEVYDVNLDGTGRGRLMWDPEVGQFTRKKLAAGDDTSSEGLSVVQNEFMSHRGGVSSGPLGQLTTLFRNVRMSFLPRGVSEDYYAFTIWRIAQRIVSSTVSVFGTQSLLLALGVKTHKVGAAAASGWVIANAIGKFAKMSFAAGWGRDFDSDAKRWRFRAALMWVFANGMEILVYVVHNNFPRSFVFLVALSVSLKQISILTSSATRGTFYKQFAGQNENLGDITAKGDAQVAIADLLGMVVGIHLARMAGSTAVYIWGAWLVLSVADFLCILKSLDTIVFKFLNLERASLIAYDFVKSGLVTTPAKMVLTEPILSRPQRAVPQGNLFTGWYWDVIRGYWAGTFRKISETTVTPAELKILLQTFANGQYMVLHSRHPKMPEAPPRPCLVLRQSATEDDVLEAMLALEHLRQSLDKLSVEAKRAIEAEPAYALPYIEAARDYARSSVDGLVKGVEEQGWGMKASGKPTLMVGYIRHRAIW